MTLAIDQWYWIVFRPRDKSQRWECKRLKLSDPLLTRVAIDSAWPSGSLAHERRTVLNDPWNE